MNIKYIEELRAENERLKAYLAEEYEAASDANAEMYQLRAELEAAEKRAAELDKKSDKYHEALIMHYQQTHESGWVLDKGARDKLNEFAIEQQIKALESLIKNRAVIVNQAVEIVEVVEIRNEIQQLREQAKRGKF